MYSLLPLIAYRGVSYSYSLTKSQVHSVASILTFTPAAWICWIEVSSYILYKANTSICCIPEAEKILKSSLSE